MSEVNNPDRLRQILFNENRQMPRRNLLELIGQLNDADFRLAGVHHPFGWFIEQGVASKRIRFKHKCTAHPHLREHLLPQVMIFMLPKQKTR